MDTSLPIVYFSSIIVFLVELTIFILFQIIKTRRTENRFSKLQEKL